MSFKYIFLFALNSSFCYGDGAPGGPQQRQGRFHFRLERSLPSVSDDHFQELTSDGTYRIMRKFTFATRRVSMNVGIRGMCKHRQFSGVKPFSEIPGPPRIPFIGNLHLYKLGYFKMSEYHSLLESLHEKYGPLVRQDIGPHTIIHVFDPDDVKAVHGVTGKTPEVPPLQQAAQLYRQKRNLTLGLGNMNGEEWYRLRSAVQQMMMRPKEVQYYLPHIDQVAQDLVVKIQSSLSVHQELKDLRTLVAKWNLESSGMICFEKRLGCLDVQEKLAGEMIEANVDIFQLSAELKFSMGLHNYFPTPKWKRFVAAEDFFFENASRFIDGAIDEVKGLLETGQLKPNQFNFLSYLLSRNDLSQEDVRIITFSLFADGLSTTTPALLFNLYSLAKYGDVQKKVYQEILENLPNETVMDVNVMNKLSYLKATVKETFRTLPGGTEVSRILPVDLVLSNFTVPAGTHVDLNQFVLFNSPNYFTDPEKFIPERWLRESSAQSQQAHHPFLLTPFGHGTRMCAGRRYAEQDLHIALTRILQRFRLELVQPNAKMERIYSTLLFPKYPLRLRFIPRDL